MNFTLSFPSAEPRVLVPTQLNLGAPPGPVLHDLKGASMGTTWSVRLAGPAQIDRVGLQEGIDGVLDRVVDQMSTWETDSAISRYNRAAAGTWHGLPVDFAQVMAGALSVAQRSGGAFDPTAGPLVDAWGFGPRARHDSPGFQPPLDAALAGLPIGWSHLALDAGGRLLQPGGFAIDLSAIAKGFAVDAVAAHLAAAGVEHHLVEIGGELRGQGVKPDGQPWWVALEPPSLDCTVTPVRVALHGLSIATSGDYRRFYRHHDRLLPHTIDPRSRRPVTHGLAAVTVIHASCMLADAWSTALMVLGPQEGLALADAEGLAAVLVWRRADGGWGEALSRAAQVLAG